MAAGALGMSTGLIYVPGTFAETGEVIALTSVVARHGGIYMSHIRNEAEQLLEAVDEAISIGREAGCPVEISHHKASARNVWGKTSESIAIIEKAREGGVDVTLDVYPYTAGSTILSAARGVTREIEPDGIMVASVREHREYEGKTLGEIGAMLGIEDPREVVNRVLADEPAAVAVFFSMHEDDVRRVLAHPMCMIGSDGIPSPTGKPHPRLYGTFPRVLGTYVREVGLITLEEGVRKMTSLPAKRMNLPDRGELREGFAADIVVFDPETIADIATYQEPRQYPAGIDYVIVNGEVAAEHGRQNAARPGRLLRRGQTPA
jgi:N-acyl-D-aspartate/D-glutamate deacylase